MGVAITPGPITRIWLNRTRGRRTLYDAADGIGILDHHHPRQQS